MRIQEYAIEAAKNAANEFFRYAEHVPDEKLEWAPDGARTVLSMCQEIGITPTWAFDVLSAEGEPEWDENASREQREMMKSWATVAACRTQFGERFSKWSEFVRSMPDEDLAKTKWLRYEGGRDFTYLELLDYVRWNSTYHVGQTAYIQTLYGDKEMY